MGQIIYGKQKPRYCNLAAIQTSGNKADTVLANGEIWMVDTTNATKANDGAGVYDAYIIGDGSKTATALTLHKVGGSGMSYEDTGVAIESAVVKRTLAYPVPSSDNDKIPTTQAVGAAIQDARSLISTEIQAAADEVAQNIPDVSGKANADDVYTKTQVDTALESKQDSISSVTVAVDANTGTPAGTVSFNNNTLAFSFQNLKGETGAQGLQGLQGLQGPEGPQGPRGNDGNTSDSNIVIVHDIDTSATYEPTTDVAGADALQSFKGDIYGVKYKYSLSDLTQGYYQGTVGSVVTGSTSAGWCKRMVLTLKIGQHIKLVTTTRGVAHAYVITDSNDIVLYTSGVGSIDTEFDVEDSTWAKMYISCADIGYDTFEMSVVEKEGLIPTIETIVAQSDNYEKAAKYVDYSSQIEEGKAYDTSGTTIATRTASSGWTYRSVKIKCAKGDIFGIVTGGVTNIRPIILCDETNTVLWKTGIGGNYAGIFEVNYDNASTLYVSANQDTNIDIVRKLPLKHDDLIEVSSPYLNSSLFTISATYAKYSGYVGISLPIVLKKGDTVRLKCKSYQNYRAYLLQNMDGTFLSAISDTDLSIEGYFTWMGDEDVYLYVNGLADDPPYITKFPKSAAATLKHYGKKIATLGDSITSYDASDIGELVRSHLGMIFLRSGNQIDWGNLAEGNATICNFTETTENFSHSDTTVVSGKYVNRTLPNEVLKLLQHTTAEGVQITWHIASDNSDHSIDTSVATGTGYTTDIPDVIYIAMGTNDWSTIDDFDTIITQTYSQLDKLTICSSLRWCLETLQNVYPKAAIICVTPIVRTQRPTAEMEAKCELIKKICAYMAIPVVDGYHISGFSPLSQKIYSADYIHPNNYTQRIARSIAAQVDALC